MSLHYTSKFIGKIRTWFKWILFNGFLSQKKHPDVEACTYFKKQTKVFRSCCPKCFFFKIQQSLRCTSRPTRHGRNGLSAICAHSPWILQVSMDTGPKNLTRKIKTKQKDTQLPGFWFLFLVFLGSCFFYR